MRRYRGTPFKSLPVTQAETAARYRFTTEASALGMIKDYIRLCATTPNTPDFTSPK